MTAPIAEVQRSDLAARGSGHQRKSPGSAGARDVLQDGNGVSCHCKGSDLSQAQIDVGLVVVIQPWPHLPEAIRKGILAMVRVAS